MPRMLQSRLTSATASLAGALLCAASGALVRVARAQPTPPVAALRTYLAPGALRAGIDSFAIVAGGAARGWQRIVVERDAAGWRLRDAVVLGAAVRQESRIRLAPDLSEVELRQEGQMGPALMTIALDWAGNRVRGTAVTPSRGAAGPLAIDTVLAPGTVDDNAVLPLLSAVRWHEALDAAFPVLASGKGTVSTYRLRVLGADSTSVPAGHFDTWRAELQGGGSTVVLHVTRAAPHRIVRASPVGAPFEMQRVR
jgi:hypothetical protein